MPKFTHFKRVIPEGHQFASMQAYASKEAAQLDIKTVSKRYPGKKVEPIKGNDLYWYLVFKEE